MFANMKIGLRLTLGFAVVLILMAALAVVGINGMSSVQGQLDEIVKDNMYKMGLNNKMAIELNNVERLIRTLMLVKDPAAQATQRQSIDKARAAYNEAFEELNKTPASEKGKAMRAKIKEGATTTRPLNDKVVDFVVQQVKPKRLLPRCWARPAPPPPNGKQRWMRTLRSRRRKSRLSFGTGGL